MPGALRVDGLTRLAALDPQLADLVTRQLHSGPRIPRPADLDRLVEETIAALSISIPLARTLAAGGAELLAHAPGRRAAEYWPQIRLAAAHGPELGQLMATALVPVIRFGPPPAVSRFLSVVAVLRAKGTYTLKRPLEACEGLLRSGDLQAAAAFLDLLQTAFDRPLSYNQSLHLSHVLPKAALDLEAPRRAFQLEALRRVTRYDFRLVDDFLDGLAAGLEMLDPEALADFVAQALARCERHRDFGRRMLALKTDAARQHFASLQRRVSLASIRPALSRYLDARLGRPLVIAPISALGEARGAAIRGEAVVCSDGQRLYLPAELDAGGGRDASVDLYKLLVRLEAGHYEHGTLDFDLERLDQMPPPANGPEPGDRCDLERFFQRFADPQLAEDLFTIAEHGRLARVWRQQTPGLWRILGPRLAQALRSIADTRPAGLRQRLYRAVVLQERQAAAGHDRETLSILTAAFEALVPPGAPVEAAARWTVSAYDRLTARHPRQGPDERLVPPFGWHVPAALFGQAQRALLRRATALKGRLEKHGIRILRSALIRVLMDHQGRLDPGQMADLLRHDTSRPPGAPRVVLDPQTLRQVMMAADPAPPPAAAPDGLPAAWYPEWDQSAGGYLADHVRVVERPVDLADPSFYADVLARRSGLAVRLRRAFELLRPQGIGLLRQWIEGDEFDYRALIDYAVDRQAGVTPSERLYIKRVKRLRDVAVLLLVDLSRSTGNPVAGGRQRVVDVEKEAIVMFCEALSVVGDRFALAGFSGSGRLGVDYLQIKDFQEPLDETARRRIAALAPRRATRMGAAIRHAAARLAAEPARVRLLIILGDGFPNDLDYKGDHAVADTRQAVGEARAQGVHTHAITVNLPQDPRLDDLYGPMHHTVIGDVAELPGKLLSVYGRLTR